MTQQLTLTIALAILLGACGTTDCPADDAGSSGDDGGSVDAGDGGFAAVDAGDGGSAAVDAGDGVCCPLTMAVSCVGGSDEPAGGWAPSLAACTLTIGGPYQEQVDARGCTFLVRRTDFGECSGPWDGGL